jgi:hypothetical protein
MDKSVSASAMGTDGLDMVDELFLNLFYEFWCFFVVVIISIDLVVLNELGDPNMFIFLECIFELKAVFDEFFLFDLVWTHQSLHFLIVGFALFEDDQLKEET